MRFVPSLFCEPPGSLSFQDGGLTAAAGTSSVHLSKTCRVATDDDKGRCLALLSVLCREPVAPEVLAPIEAAAAYWAAGDKALANLRLVFSDLPKLREPADIHRLEAAAWCLDQGLTPGELMRALGLDSGEVGLAKYNAEEPRVPRGSIEGGEWTFQTNLFPTDNEMGRDSSPNLSNPNATQDNSEVAHPSLNTDSSSIILAATTTNFEHACKKLGLDMNEASNALHDAKGHAGLGAADNCVFDLQTGDIFFQGEHIGNLGD